MSFKGIDFGRGILEKYGWKEGKGLGRNEDGIVKALKPALKFDNAGVGHDGISEQFTSRWWERSFNNVAENITVVQGKGGVKVEQKNKVGLFTSKDTRPVSMFATTDYGSFIKKTILTGDRTVHLEETSTSDGVTNDVTPAKAAVLSDEEIFRACGGRTVHKGARHGLKLNGKLARIQRQEQLLLDHLNSQRSSYLSSDTGLMNVTKSEKDCEALGWKEGTRMEEDVDRDPVSKTKGKRRKKKNTPDSFSELSSEQTKKKKERKLMGSQCDKDISAAGMNSPLQCDTYSEDKIVEKGNKKKKKRKKNDEGDDSKVPYVIPPKSKNNSKRNKELDFDENEVELAIGGGKKHSRTPSQTRQEQRELFSPVHTEWRKKEKTERRKKKNKN